MQIITADLETFWSQTHSLSKMSPLDYCMSDETELISLAIKMGSAPTLVVFGEEAIQAIVDDIDWSQTMLVGHNMSAFDAMIFAWRLSVRPAVWGCTLAMARARHAKKPGVGLGKLVEWYKLGVKDNTALLETKGKKLDDFTKAERYRMAAYNKDDTDQCYALFKKLRRYNSNDELMLIDMTIRMLVEPQFEVDIELLKTTHAQEDVRKQRALRNLTRALYHDPKSPAHSADVVADPDYLRTQLASAPKFKALLEFLGVEVPLKESPSVEGKMIPALAKTDPGFVALLESSNDLVRSAAEMRLDVKSTLLQTRIKKILAAVDAHPEGKLPIPLKYNGADTTWRWSGFLYNPQNLPRINPYDRKPSDALRNSLRAPEGHAVVVADQSGIELRVNHILWKVPSSLDLYTKDPEHADLYKEFASALYETLVTDVTKEQRQVGKVSHLGLGFGAGWKTFKAVAKIMAGITLDESEAQDIVREWRQQYSEITDGWKLCQKALDAVFRKLDGDAVDPWGMIEPRPNGLKTPKGFIYYPNLVVELGENGRKEYRYGRKTGNVKIYGGKVDENIVQHLARTVIAENALEVWKRTGIRPAHIVHDELIYVVPTRDAERHLETVQDVMRTPPEWWPELKTWSEGSIADTYGAAK